MKMEGSLCVLAIALAALGGACVSAVRHSKTVVGQSPQSFTGQTKTRKTIQAQYLLYLPPRYPESDQGWPLILFLHGAGERGVDLEKVKMHGPPKLIATEGKEFPFVIVSPQCPEDGWWSNEAQIEMLDALLDHVEDRYRIDSHRIYVTGLSMGGFGTWQLALTYPHRFAAIAPICGGGNPQEAARIRHLPVWVFHGAEDAAVAVERSQEMVDALKRAGSHVTFTVYPQAGHDSWTQTYHNPELYEWLLKHRRWDEK